MRNLRFQSSYCAKVGAKAKNKTKQNKTKQNKTFLSITLANFLDELPLKRLPCYISKVKSPSESYHTLLPGTDYICVQVLISSLTIHNFHLYCFEKGFDLIFFITSTFPRHTFGKISHFRNVPKLLRLVPTVELPLKANQGHPTSIFEKYLFERRFAF